MRKTHDRQGVVATHWRGQEPPGRSVALAFVLPLLGLLLAVDGLLAWMALHGGWLRVASVALVLGLGLLVAVLVWGAVGAWRGAGKAAQGRQRWTLRAAVVSAALLVIAALALNIVPRSAPALRLLLGVDPLGQVVQTVSPDGRRLRLQGWLGMDDAARVGRALVAAPLAGLVELDLQGGRWHEAHELGQVVRQRGPVMRVIGACDDACVLPFMAGRGRQVMPGGRLGLGRLDPGALNPLMPWLAKRWLAATLGAAMLPEGFIVKALSTPPGERWQPEVDELLLGGVIGVPGRPLDVHLPAAPGASVDEFAEALTSNPAWRVMASREPGLIEAGAERMQGADAGGAADDAVQIAGQSVIAEWLPELLRGAGPAQRDLYLQLLNDQLQAARPAGDEACRGVLTGDTAARRALPTALVLREATWLVDTAAMPAEPPQPLTLLAREVMRRALGDGAPALIGSIRRPKPGEGCDRPAALLAEVLRLPPGERKLAVRLMFDTR